MNRRGFTLIELLVVIGIIGILIAALIPAAKGAQTRAKEAAVKTQAANIEAGLANFAQNHSGNYPGIALDVMAPYGDHGLGDNGSVPPLYSAAPQNQFDVAAGRMVQGVLGGFGHYNNSSANAFEQLRTAKNTPLTAGTTGTRRYFDALMLSDALQEFPANPFATSNSTGERQRMRNIFTFQIDVNAGFDANNQFSPGVNAPGAAFYNCALNVQRNGTNVAPAQATNDTFDTSRVFLRHTTLPGGLPTIYTSGFQGACKFGVEEGDYFAPGDFAYIPVLSTSPYAFGDTLATLENERFKWGAQVTGYMMFAYGQRTHKTREFDAEAKEFSSEGFPGYGNAGVDTIYENYALQCFEGAIYHSKKY
ncbi:MAG: prepilin-type N-terminal cleavage/methylation domain-containing protein [bacterium]|nr:prepilin-type N-terminal cleavage/methylation domain-containing protein [bacterium]